MAVRIRLKKIGKRPKHRPYFRIGVYSQQQGRDSRSIEELGHYNPVNGSVKVKLERFEYWQKNGAEISQTVKSLIKKFRKEAR